MILVSLPSLLLCIPLTHSSSTNTSGSCHTSFCRLNFPSLSPYTFSSHSSASMPCLALNLFTPPSLWLHGCLPRCLGLFLILHHVSCDVLLPHLAICPISLFSVELFHVKLIRRDVLIISVLLLATDHSLSHLIWGVC